MSPFHKPRLSSAAVFALLCISFSSAIPVANPERPRVSIIGASEPVNILDADDFDIPPQPAPSTIPEGDTLVTTFFPPKKDGVRKRQPLSQAGASEPVNIIPVNELPPGHIWGAGSNSSSDGTTFTTDYHLPANSSRGRPNDRSSLSLVGTSSLRPQLSEVNMGLNCEGSRIMCFGAAAAGVMHTLRDYMYAIPHGYHYYAGQKIACMKHSTTWITIGYYCAFMQGNITPEGEDGAVIQLKMQQMIEHNCLGCGSVPFSSDNDPNTAGILTVNYVHESECEGLCYYVPPGTPENSVKVPKGMTLTS